MRRIGVKEWRPGATAADVGAVAKTRAVAALMMENGGVAAHSR